MYCKRKSSVLFLMLPLNELSWLCLFINDYFNCSFLGLAMAEVETSAYTETT